MEENKRENYLIETDIFVEHLTNGNESPSVLEKYLMDGDCFTTVLNASELFYYCENSEENEAVKKLLNGIKVLGLSARYSLSIYEFHKKVKSVRDAIICAAAKINKLTIVTLDKNRFANCGQEIIYP